MSQLNSKRGIKRPYLQPHILEATQDTQTFLEINKQQQESGLKLAVTT